MSEIITLCRHGQEPGRCLKCQVGGAANGSGMAWSDYTARSMARRNGLVELKPPCKHLGPRLIRRTSCRVELWPCFLHDDECTRLVIHYDKRNYHTCKDYGPASSFVSRASDPAVGVVIGHWSHWPELIDLQIRLIRHTCGPSVPILVSDDCSPCRERLPAICDRPGVELQSRQQRIGHVGGDLAALHDGLMWARRRGLSTLVKLSCRMLWTRPRWIQDGALELLASGLPLASRRLLDDPGLHGSPLRTECLWLDVAAWSDLLPTLAPRPWPDVDAETVVLQLLCQHLGGLYWPIAWLTACRFRPDGLSAHHGDVRLHREIAKLHGVALPAGYHLDGWMAPAHAAEFVRG